MHSLHRGDYTLHHNGDYSGDVRVVHDPTGAWFEMPSRLLFDFVAEGVRSRRIAQLEQADTEALLGFAPRS